MSDNFFRVHKGVALAPQALVPTNAQDGDVYYDTTDSKFKFRQASVWKELGSDAVPPDLSAYLKHDGSVAITGVLAPVSANSINIGSDTLFFNTVYGRVWQVMSSGGIIRGGLLHNGTGVRLSSADTIILDATNGIINTSNARIINVATPTAATDAVNKAYVDGLSSGAAWKFATATAGLNDATAISMFGTKTGDFNLELYRNAVKMMEFQSDRIAMSKYIQMGGGGAEDIKSTSALYLSALNGGMNLTTPDNGGSSLRLQTDRIAERLSGGGLTTLMTTYKSGLVKTLAPATLADTFAFNLQLNNHYHFELECFMHALNGATKCNLFKKLNVHIDTNRNLVTAQDTFSSKNAAAVNFAVSAAVVAGQLVLTYDFGSDSGAFTAKEMKIKITQTSAE